MAGCRNVYSKTERQKGAGFAFLMKGSNSAKHITAVFMLNTCFNLDPHEKECLWIHPFTSSARGVKIRHDKFYKTQAERCHNVMDTLGQFDLAEMLFRELIKSVFSEEGKVVVRENLHICNLQETCSSVFRPMGWNASRSGWSLNNVFILQLRFTVFLPGLVEFPEQQPKM